MTLYRNLGSISFQCQTKLFQIFSAKDSAHIIQFKNYHEVDLDEIQKILSIYDLILKQEGLMQLYAEKNKPVSILIHRATRITFKKISIHLLCKIVRQLVISIIHIKKIIPDKVGEINRQLFLEIEGQLKYIYLPILSSQSNNNNIIDNVVDLFKELKDEKQASHRLLFKKVCKCNSLQQIMEEIQYFISIYHVKQQPKSIQQTATSFQQTFFSKPLTKSKGYGNFFNDPKTNQLLNPKTLVNFTESSTNKQLRNRKYNLFKNPYFNKSKTSLAQQISSSSSTWRSPQRDNSLQQFTYRRNSRAIHIDSHSKGLAKTTSFSQFNRTNFFNQTVKKVSLSKKTGPGRSLYQNLRNSSHLNQSVIKNKSRPISGRKRNKTNQKTEESIQPNSCNQQKISQKFQKSFLTAKGNDYSNRNVIENQNNLSQSVYLKQMVHASLEKRKSKEALKVNIFNTLFQKNKQRSTQGDSRSKFTQLIGSKHFQETNIRISTPNHKKQQKNYQPLQNSNQFHSQISNGHQKKLKRKVIANKHQNEKEQEVLKSFEKINIIKKPKQKVQEYQVQQQILKQQQSKDNPIQEIEKACKSQDEIHFQKISLEHLTLKNKQEEEIQKRKKLREKTSIKEIHLKQQKSKKNTDESETQRIQYNPSSKKIIKSSRKEQKCNFQISEDLHKISLQLKNIYKQKEQIDYIGVAVVQTNDHLKNFESIFWQLPMFFLYKKFYQRRLKLYEQVSQILFSIGQKQQPNENVKQLQSHIRTFHEDINTQNVSIQQSLRKLLKTVKKKVKKAYPNKSQQDYIQSFLHLDYTIQYTNVVNQFVSMYLNSLLEAKQEFPQLIFHIVQIYEAVIAYSEGTVKQQARILINEAKSSQEKLRYTQSYFQQLSKVKQINNLITSKDKKTVKQKTAKKSSK